MAQGKFILIDGNSLVYRAFYALPLLSTKEGVFTNAVYGFTNMLMKILNEEDPKCIAIAFDKGKITFRNERYEDYKGNRKATPDELRPQFPLIKEIVRAFNIPVYELEGYEADDIIGTASCEAEELGYDTLIVTGDRDALQLVSPRTTVMLTKKGISEMELYNEEKVKERYGITPLQVIDMKGLMGDSSDNIPGVPGIGEKTAIKFIKKYGSVEETLAHASEQTPKMKERLEQHSDQAVLSKELATIVRSVPMEIDLRECEVEEPDYEKLLEIGQNLAFKALTKTAREKLQQQGKELPEGIEESQQEEQVTGTYNKIEDFSDDIVKAIDENGKIALALEMSGENPFHAELLGTAYCFEKGRANYLGGSQVEKLKKLISENEKKIDFYFHDAKKAKVLLEKLGFELSKVDFDTMLAAYLLNPAVSNQDLGKLSSEYLDLEYEEKEDYTDYCVQADIIFRLQKQFKEKLEELGMDDLYYNVEMPLLYILGEMELTGVALDKGYLNEMSKTLGEKIEGITQEIYSLAGEEFNINSTKQLGVILFEKLELPVVKKTKTGYSTNVEVLEALADRHEIVELILHYRQLVKLKSTYVDGLTALINEKTGKIHTTFNQTVTATGRLSSTEPNLQNIPIRLEEGRKIRKAFIPSEEGWQILSADYSQIELRILAHLSGDEKFVQAFRNNEDIHARTAAEVFGVPIEEVTREMRGHAKAVNFGIVYGISDYGLSKSISVSRKEAKTFIDNYFARYAGVKEYLENSVSQAKEKGHVTTLLNRRRYLPDLLSRNQNIRKFGERTAMNTPIQGSAADIIKLAMIKIDKCLKEKELKTRMLLQVHDELIFEIPPEEKQLVIPLVRECMENVCELDIPLTVDMKIGSNWYDMEKIND